MRRRGGGWGRARRGGGWAGGCLDGLGVGWLCWYGGVAGADATVGFGVGVFRLWFRA